MKKLFFCALIAAAISLTGCSTTNVSDLVKAMGNDPACLSIKVSSVYGTVSVVRVGARTNDTVTASPDGTLTVKSAQ